MKMKYLLNSITDHTGKRLSANPENGSFQNPQLIQLITLIMLCLSMSAWGQVKQVKVAGTVTDEEGKALPGTQVVLVQIADTTKRFSVAAADNGLYSIGLPTGIYRLQATCIGFRLFTAEVDATQDMTVDIPMVPDTKQLNEVVVRARRIRYDAEGYSVNIGQIPALRKEPLDVILQFMPGLMVVNDRLTLFGRKIVSEVYVNRRKIRLQGSQLLSYLNTIQGATVKNVKVIMSRGAEARASAANTVALKITTENLADGGMLMVGASLLPIGSYRSYRFPTLRFQNKQGRWSVYGSLIDGLSYNDGESETSTMFLSSGTTHHTTMESDSESMSLHGRFGIGYDFSPNDLLTIEAGTDLFKSDGKTNMLTEFTDAGNRVETMENKSKDKSTDNSNQLFADYTHVWKKGELSASIGYAEGRDRRNAHQWRLSDEQTWDSHNYSKLSRKVFSSKIDLTQKIDNNQSIKAGMAYDSWNYDTNTDNRLVIDGSEVSYGNYTDLFTYKERIAAMYASYDFTLKSFSASLGLRYEHETVEPSSQQSPEHDYKKEYDRLFPNIRLSYTIDAKHGHNMRLSFSRALANPDRNSLNPSIRWDNEYSYTMGNPFLAPTAYYQGDLSLTFFSRLMINANYSNRHIYRAFTYKMDGSDIMYSSTDDLGKQRRLQLSASYGKPITKKWMMNVNLTSFFTREKHLEEKMNSTAFIASIRSNNTLPKGYRLNTSIAWMSSEESLQIKSDSKIQFSTNLRKQFLKNRLALTLGYEYWPISESTLKTADIIQRRTNDYNPHRIQFSAQYQLRWGSLRAKVRQAKSTQL